MGGARPSGDPGGVRKPSVAGSFYPSSPPALRQMVRHYLQNALPEWSGPLKAIIAPHAGFVYSGWVAAYAYAAIRGRAVSTVVMAGPAHYPVSYGGFSLYARGAWETPLGEVGIDEELARALLEHPQGGFADRPEAHIREHCLEVQLPFLQEVAPECRIVPILMRDQGLERCRQLAAALASVWHEGVLLLASTDLSHYYSKAQASTMDSIVAKHVDDFDAEGLSRALDSGDSEMCGGGPAVSILLAAKGIGATTARVLKHADSSDSPDGRGGRSEVVGYLAAAIG